MYTLLFVFSVVYIYAYTRFGKANIVEKTYVHTCLNAAHNVLIDYTQAVGRARTACCNLSGHAAVCPRLCMVWWWKALWHICICTHTIYT